MTMVDLIKGRNQVQMVEKSAAVKKQPPGLPGSLLGFTLFGQPHWQIKTKQADNRLYNVLLKEVIFFKLFVSQADLQQKCHN